jgi:hypothetical protein
VQLIFSEDFGTEGRGGSAVHSSISIFQMKMIRS